MHDCSGTVNMQNLTLHLCNNFFNKRIKVKTRFIFYYFSHYISQFLLQNKERSGPAVSLAKGDQSCHHNFIMHGQKELSISFLSLAMNTPNYYFTTPFENDYLITLGTTTATFATLEWNIVYVIVGLDDNQWKRNLKNKTAGHIQTLLDKAISETTRPLSPDQITHLQTMSADFKDAVNLRNSIIHGKPATSPTNQKPTIIDNGIEWTIDKMGETIMVFQEISARANAFYHDHLK
jgi:hypothetical protein